MKKDRLSKATKRSRNLAAGGAVSKDQIRCDSAHHDEELNPLGIRNCMIRSSYVIEVFRRRLSRSKQSSTARADANDSIFLR